MFYSPYEKGHLIDKIDRLQRTVYDSAVISIESEEDLKNLEKQSSGLPFVIYNHSSSKYSSVSYLADEAIAQAVKMIAAKGFKDILVFSGSDSWQHGDEYLKLLIRYCEENEILLSEDTFINTENTMIGGAIDSTFISDVMLIMPIRRIIKNINIAEAKKLIE